MSNHIKSFGKSIGERWKEEWMDFQDSRKEFWNIREFRIAIFLSLPTLISIPLFIFFGINGANFAIFLLLFPILWFMGLGFITVGNVLFDNIPLVSDISSIVDAMDGAGLHKVSYISKVLKKKEYFENHTAGILRGTLIFLTAYLFRKAKLSMRMVMPTLRFAFPNIKISLHNVGIQFRIVGRAFEAGHHIRMMFIEVPVLIWDSAKLIWYCGMFAFGCFMFVLSCLMFLAPVCGTAIVGILGMIANLRPSIARLPIFIPASIYLSASYAIVVIITLMGFPQQLNFMIVIPIILSGYTFFFIEHKDFLMVHEVFPYIIGNQEVSFRIF